MNQDTVGKCESYQPILFVTKNMRKLQEARDYIEKWNPSCTVPQVRRKVSALEIELKEIQAAVTQLDVIVKEKVVEAYKQCKLPLEGAIIVEDTSLSLNVLNGLPGPYIKWTLDALGAPGIHDILLNGHSDKSATAICCIAFLSGKDLGNSDLEEGPVKSRLLPHIKVFRGECKGRIVPYCARNQPSFGWDGVFVPDQADTTFACMTVEEKNRYSHRAKAFNSLLDWLSSETL